jgi:hypothetical protein
VGPDIISIPIEKLLIHNALMAGSHAKSVDNAIAGTLIILIYNSFNEIRSIAGFCCGLQANSPDALV